jgi:hypothetical protein
MRVNSLWETFRSMFGQFWEFIKGWYKRRVVEKSLLGQVLRKTRRAFLGNFRSEYVQKSVQETRKGDCNHCGLCCKLIYKCPFVGHDKAGLSYCRIYGIIRPASCRNYPFDVIDSEIAECSYSFKSKLVQTSQFRS